MMSLSVDELTRCMGGDFIPLGGCGWPWPWHPACDDLLAGS